MVDKHLTLEQLAEQTGLSKSALGKYETDDYKDISPFAIATLADFYGVSTDYLMGLTENKNHPNTELQSLHLSDEMCIRDSHTPDRYFPWGCGVGYGVQQTVFLGLQRYSSKVCLHVPGWTEGNTGD